MTEHRASKNLVFDEDSTRTKLKDFGSVSQLHLTEILQDILSEPLSPS